MEQRGLEPLTSALRTRRSAKLSYCPTRNKILQFQVSHKNALSLLSYGESLATSKPWCWLSVGGPLSSHLVFPSWDANSLIASVIVELGQALRRLG